MDGTGAALSGRTLLTGWPDRDPVIPGAVPYGDVIVPYVMAATRRCRARARARAAGRGCHIDASMYEICVQQMADAIAAAARGAAPERAGQRGRRACFHQGVYRGAAARIAGSRSRSSTTRLVASCRRSDRACRRGQRDDRCAMAALAHWLSARDAMPSTRLQARGIAAGVVQDVEDLVERDPQIAARGALVDARPPAARRVRAHAHADRRFRAAPIAPFRAPALGEHSRQIARDALRPHAARASQSSSRWESSDERSSAIDRRRSRKDLACTAAATAYQRDFVADLKRRVVEKGEPFAIAQADTPHEIFHAMDIPLVSNQWWSAYISAKQLSPRYFDVLDRHGLSPPTAAATARSVSPARSTTIRRPRRGAACRGRRCWSRGSPATASSDVFDAVGRGARHRVLSARGARLDCTRTRDWFRKSSSDWEQLYEPRPHRAAGGGDARR